MSHARPCEVGLLFVLSKVFRDRCFFVLRHLSVTSFRFNTLTVAIQAQPGTPSPLLVGGDLNPDSAE